MVTAVRDGRKSSKTSVIRRPRKIKTIREPVILGNRGSFPCPYCAKIFSQEKTVASHLCEQRRRFEQKETLFARYGYEAFVAIQDKFFGKQTKKSEEDFRKSDFYLACLRWGHFVLDINSLNAKQYLNWLLIKNVPIDQWDKDEIYDCWLQHYVFIEEPWDAFERSIKKMREWSEETSKSFDEYFQSAGTARILTDVRKGWISGWSVFCSKGGREWLHALEQGDLELVWAWLDPARWKIRLERMTIESEEITKICSKAGL